MSKWINFYVHKGGNCIVDAKIAVSEGDSLVQLPGLKLEGDISVAPIINGEIVKIPDLYLHQYKLKKYKFNY